MITKLDINLDYEQIVKEYYDLKIDNLLKENNHFKQLAIQCRAETSDDIQLYESCGSLYYDWFEYSKNPVGNIPFRKIVYKEEEFSNTCNIFKNTLFEKLIDNIRNSYDIVRGRFMLMNHKTCLTYHSDPSPRIHVPIYTNKNCMMIIDDIVYRMPFGATYLVDTTIPHTALNASKDPRVHLIFSVRN